MEQRLRQPMRVTARVLLNLGAGMPGGVDQDHGREGGGEESLDPMAGTTQQLDKEEGVEMIIHPSSNNLLLAPASAQL